MACNGDVYWPRGALLLQTSAARICNSFKRNSILVYLHLCFSNELRDLGSLEQPMHGEAKRSPNPSPSQSERSSNILWCLTRDVTRLKGLLLFAVNTACVTDSNRFADTFRYKTLSFCKPLFALPQLSDVTATWVAVMFSTIELQPAP